MSSSGRAFEPQDGRGLLQKSSLVSVTYMVVLFCSIYEFSEGPLLRRETRPVRSRVRTSRLSLIGVDWFLGE